MCTFLTATKISLFIAITWLVVKMLIFLLWLFCGTMIVSVLVYFKKIYRKTKSKELLIFSRYPTPGTTKTRLIPKLGEECASYVQLLMVCILIYHMMTNIFRSFSYFFFIFETSSDCGSTLQYSYGTVALMVVVLFYWY